MTDTTPPPDGDVSRLATSRVVTNVFDQILAAVHDGSLRPGQRISDAELAEQFGVSRTPVREALQRLREIGIIEASASRFTRIADVTPIQTAQALVVWLALYRALVEEVVPRASDAALDALEKDNQQYLEAMAAIDPPRIARTTFDFFSHLPRESENATMQRAITSVVHIIRLGSLHLPEHIDFQALGRSQALLIDAVRAHDPVMARKAMDVLGGIEVPLE